MPFGVGALCDCEFVQPAAVAQQGAGRRFGLAPLTRPLDWALSKVAVQVPCGHPRWVVTASHDDAPGLLSSSKKFLKKSLRIVLTCSVVADRGAYSLGSVSTAPCSVSSMR